MNFRTKLFLSFFLIFSIFTVGIIVFEQSREKKYKTEALIEKLDAYTNIFNETYKQNFQFDSILKYFPLNIRLSIIDNQGFVIYDNVVKISDLENHSARPEIQTAQKEQKGYDIRISVSNHQPYLYYAKYFGLYYIRTSLPYDVQVRNFLKTDKFFLYYIIALFLFVLLLINYASGRFGKSIRKLNVFTSLIENGDLKNENPAISQFPKDELGEIGKKIAENYKLLNESKKAVLLEREKLLQHVHSSEEGICFFDAYKLVEFYNGLFLQYLNIIIDKTGNSPQIIFSDVNFEKINNFLSERKKDEHYFETKIEKQGKVFAIRLNVFENGSFEIIINDITKIEKQRLLKQEIIGNITHELKTPVTGIRGCLETILENKLENEKEKYFIRKAYERTLSLSELISDMGLLTKIEDAPQYFARMPVKLFDLLEELKADFEIPLKEKNIKIDAYISESIVINGNKSLLYAIFRNLTDNAVLYAGNNITIKIEIYNEDNDFYYFSFSDNGVGITGEQHLNRLFERFYRSDEGRTRDTGGSGLGLSIVKNAVIFHKGKISVKNKINGGLEFLFNLSK